MKFLKNCMLMVAALLLITSCSKSESKMESQIPADATLVIKANIPQLVKNLGIEIKGGEMVLPQKFAQMLKDNGMDLEKNKGDIEKFLKSGIDFDGSIYAFQPAKNAGGKDEFSFVALIPVDDEAKLEAFLKEDAKLNFEDKDGLKLAKSGTSINAIKDGILYIAEGNVADPAAKINALAKLDKSAGDNKSIAKALDTNDDVNIYVDTKNLKEQIKEVAGYMGGNDMSKVILELIDVKSSALHMNLSGNEITIKTDNEVDNNSGFAKLVKSVTGKPSADLLAYMPKASNMGVFNLSLNGEGILHRELLKPYVEQFGSDPMMQKMMEIVKSINGPVAIGFASENLSPEDVDVAFAIKCGKAEEFAAMAEEMMAGSLTKKGDVWELNPAAFGMGGTLSAKKGVVCMRISRKGYSENMGGISDAKDVLGNSISGAFCSLKIDNMQLQLTSEGKDVKEGKMVLWVKEDGKKMNILDALTFFMKAKDKAGAIVPTR